MASGFDTSPHALDRHLNRWKSQVDQSHLISDLLPCRNTLSVASKCERRFQDKVPTRIDHVLSNFNDRVAVFQLRDNCRPHADQSLEQDATDRIANSHPYDTWTLRSCGFEKHEILVLGDDARSGFNSFLPYRPVGGLRHPEVLGVRGLMADGDQRRGEARRQVGVNEESHHSAAAMTGWSTARAAYSSAAVMSSSSR